MSPRVPTAEESARELDERRSAECITRLVRQWLFRRRLRRRSAFGISTETDARVVVRAWPGVSLIQRAWRARRFRMRWNGMLEVLGARYKLEGGDAANTSSENGLYSAAMLLRRERMWRDERLQDVLERAWTAVASATALRIFSAAPPESGSAGLTWKEYFEMSRKLAVALRVKHTPGSGSVHDMACADFEHDTREWPDPTTPLLERTLSKEAFARSWFELADVYTAEVDAAAFEAFVDATARTIVKQDLYGTFMLRPEPEILAILAAKPRERIKLLAAARLARNADGSERRPFVGVYRAPTRTSVAHSAAQVKAQAAAAGKPASRRPSDTLEARTASALSSARTSLCASQKPTPPPSRRSSMTASRRTSLTPIGTTAIAPGSLAGSRPPSQPSSRRPSLPPAPPPAHCAA